MKIYCVNISEKNYLLHIIIPIPIQNTSQSLEVETSWKQLPLMSQQDLGFWRVGYDSAHVQCKGSLERWSVIFWFSLYVCILLLRLYRTSTQKRPP